MRRKVAIIGAGVTGLAAGQLFKDKGYEVVVFEKNDVPGGLISCSYVDGVLFHKVGGHVFNSRIQDVLSWFWSKFDKSDFCSINRIAKIYLNNQTLGYPVENYLYMLDADTVKNVMRDLLAIYKSDNIQTVNNFDDFLKVHFGETLYNIYFKPYNDKIWKTELNKIPLEWLNGKLPMPDILEILSSNIVREEESTMVHSTFWYPQKGGSQFIADTLAKELNINYNQSISKIERIGLKWQINGDNYDEIIYTGDLRKLSSILSDNILPFDIKESLSDLKSNGTSNVLCEIDKNDYSWMYFPESKYKIHRIIYTGSFSENNNANSSRNTCTIEYSGYLSKEELTKEVSQLPGSPKVLAYNYEPNSYIYHLNNTSDIVSTVKRCLETQSFYLIGRFAEWEYYNMDKAIEAGMNLLKRLEK